MNSHLGQLKAKLAKLRKELVAPTSGGGGAGGEVEILGLSCGILMILVVGFDVARTGVASVYVSPSTALREDIGLRVVGDLLVLDLTYPPLITGAGLLRNPGFPSVGKSTLLNLLTGTHSEAADYEFTTVR